MTRAARLLFVGLHALVKKGDTPNAYLLTLQRPKCILRRGHAFLIPSSAFLLRPQWRRMFVRAEKYFWTQSFLV